MKWKIIRCTELTRGTTQWPPQPAPLSILPHLSLRVLSGQTGVPEKHTKTLKGVPHSLIIELDVDLDCFEGAEPTRSLGEGRAELLDVVSKLLQCCTGRRTIVEPELFQPDVQGGEFGVRLSVGQLRVSASMRIV